MDTRAAGGAALYTEPPQGGVNQGIFAMPLHNLAHVSPMHDCRGHAYFWKTLKSYGQLISAQGQKTMQTLRLKIRAFARVWFKSTFGISDSSNRGPR